MSALSRLMFALALGAVLAAGVVGFAYRVISPPPSYCIELPAGQTPIGGSQCLWLEQVTRDTVVAQGVIHYRVEATGQILDRRVVTRVDPASVPPVPVPSPYPYLIATMWLTAGAYVILGWIEAGRRPHLIRRGSGTG